MRSDSTERPGARGPGGGPRSIAASLVLLSLCATGCDRSDDPGICATGVAHAQSAGAPGEACDPSERYEGCFSGKRMRCEGGTGWTLEEVCAADMDCVQTPRPGSTTLFNTWCCPAGSAPPPLDASINDTGPVDAAPPPDDAGGGPGPDADDPVCKRWLSDRVDLSEGTYAGADFASCIGGQWKGPGHDNALRLINLYRFLAGLPAVQATAALDLKAQACAFLMAANDKLSHTPEKSWSCYNDVAAEAASKSNLSTAAAVRAIDRYMVDEGKHNWASLGHRRWLLSARIGPVGIGSTGETKTGDGQASCVWVVGEGKVDRPWITWPPAGKVPLQALGPRGVSIDSTGWSITSETIDPTQANVKVSAGGEDLAIHEWRTLTPKLGSTYGLAFQPNGWTVEAGETYTVEITGVAKPLKWSFTVLDCGG